MSAEDYITQTGDPNRGAEYVQYLGEGSERVDNYELHQRITGAGRGPGVTLVDDRIREFDDGRVAYLSAFQDEVLAVIQWGGPLATLGRLAATLLSNRAFSKVLNPSNLGGYFPDLHDGAINELEEEIEDVIKWGHQVGWFSKDEAEYDGWRDRFGGLRASLLEKVGELAGSTDFDDRAELMKDLHGLIASISQIYAAADVDITVNLRVPDVPNLMADDRRYGDFLDFMHHTVPKHAVYNHHSGYRMLLEHRPEKLKRRLSYDIDPADLTMDLTMNWLVSGRTATELKEDLEQEFNQVQDELRKAVADGKEQAAIMEIPVYIGNSYRAIKDVIKEFASRKGFAIGVSIRLRKHGKSRTSPVSSWHH